MNKNIEVEGNEIAIENEDGNIAIIPKDKVTEVEKLIENNKNSDIDNIVGSLPTMSSYAEDGSVFDDIFNKKEESTSLPNKVIEDDPISNINIKPKKEITGWSEDLPDIYDKYKKGESTIIDSKYEDLTPSQKVERDIIDMGLVGNDKERETKDALIEKRGSFSSSELNRNIYDLSNTEDRTDEQNKELESLQVEKKRFKGSVASDRFKEVNKEVTDYKLGAKGRGYGDTDFNQSDCSGGVCKYLDKDYYTTFMKDSTDLYKEGESIKKEELSDGDAFYMENKSGGINHIGIVGIDEDDNTKLFHVNGADNGLGEDDLEEYETKMKRGYNFHYFRPVKGTGFEESKKKEKD